MVILNEIVGCRQLRVAIRNYFRVGGCWGGGGGGGGGGNSGTSGVWGHVPPLIFLFIDSLRLFLVHSQGLCSE